MKHSRKKEKALPQQTPAPEEQAQAQLNKIKGFLKSIPENPGVYKMKDDQGQIIYIGKAKNLRKRVAQYFQLSKAQSIKVKKMVEKVSEVDYIMTNTEFEALVLETNLIKEYRPRYNVLMRDDKNYVYIKVSTNEDYPRLSIVRKRERDGALYFGPKTSADACEKLINILRKIFPIRTCTLEIVKFLKGSVQELITKLKYDMFKLADEKKFERAAKLRDQIKQVEGMFARQLVSDPEFVNRDVIGVHPDFDKTFINLFQFRDGKLITQENFTLDTPQYLSASDQEQQSSVIESFLRSYYSEATDVPAEIFLRETPLDPRLWLDWLTSLRHELNQLHGGDDRKSVRFLTPMKGKKNKILELSEKNAATFARQSRAKWMSDAAKTSQAARDLAEELGISESAGQDQRLRRIECYDISHMAGEHTTASMVVFVKGAAEKKLYRHFKVKTLENGEVDDYAAIEEILTRRMQRLAQFAQPTLDSYHFKKPVKKDFEKILAALRDEGILTVGEEDLGEDNNLRLPGLEDPKHFVGLYRGENGGSRLVGYGSYCFPNGQNSPILGPLWIEGEHANRALLHQLWRKLLEKLKVSHVYAICDRGEREDYLSFGFTELKKVPEFLSLAEDDRSPLRVENPTYMIYKLVKKSQKADSSFSQTPDLIIIDGGKGQLGVIDKIVKASGLQIPVIGLAKREEEIFTPLNAVDGATPDACPSKLVKRSRKGAGAGAEPRFRRILLPKNSQALYLVQRIRDESHRFANELRKKLGKKKLTESEIDDIPGIGQIIKRRLLKEYGSINAIKAAPMHDLEKVVGAYIAKMLKEKLGDNSGEGTS